MASFAALSWLAAALLPRAAWASGAAPSVRLRNGVEMPLLAAGTWQYNESQAEASVANAIKAGFTMFDTAYDYHNQPGVGRAVRAATSDHGIPREKLFVETKVPGCGLDPAVSVGRCYEDTHKALAKNVELLGLDYVDLVILHFPPRAAFVTRTCRFVCKQVRDQWRAMEEFLATGSARAIGVSNYCPSCFACLDGVAQVYPMVNQIAYHIGMGPDPAGFKSLADEKGVVLQAYSPLGNTPWKHGADPEIMSGTFTTGLADAHGKSTIQVALKWLVQHKVPVVTKSSSLKHLEQDIDLWSWNLTESELDAADKYRNFGMPSFACNFADQVTPELVV
uniref:NADP-dependent oxidoreductase domain-containing protein n=1 Tax=Zooxanthella nutricula TaxID=1333877 RepID=A0A7S2Q7F3_9DINO